MSTKHRPRHRRPSWKADSAPVTIRVGSRGSTKRYHELQAFGARDAGRFARLVDDQVRAYPKDPLVISINAFQPWLGDVIHSCISECWSEIADLDRAVQYGNTMQFPEKASKRGKYVPWTFIVEYVDVKSWSTHAFTNHSRAKKPCECSSSLLLVYWNRPTLAGRLQHTNARKLTHSYCTREK